MPVLQDAVLSWYKINGRKLPWRETQDPYKILVSEMMLQQTQVDRVIPKYENFLKLYPDMQSLAAAPRKEVLKQWSGLGYNRRALFLQKCAQEVLDKHKGEFPRRQGELLALPGIGKYTGPAVLSFAFNADVPVIDINIERLFKRIFYNQFENPLAVANHVLPLGRSRDWHNALMDLGSTFCKAKKPRCGDCPINSHCRSANNPDRIEKTWKKKKVKKFKDSDRIVRGRIVKLLTLNDGLPLNKIYQTIEGEGIHRERKKFDAIVSKLEENGLIRIERKRVWLG